MYNNDRIIATVSMTEKSNKCFVIRTISGSVNQIVRKDKINKLMMDLKHLGWIFVYTNIVNK